MSPCIIHTQTVNSSSKWQSTQQDRRSGVKICHQRKCDETARSPAYLVGHFNLEAFKTSTYQPIIPSCGTSAQTFLLLEEVYLQTKLFQLRVERGMVRTSFSFLLLSVSPSGRFLFISSLHFLSIDGWLENRKSGEISPTGVQREKKTHFIVEKV